MQKWTVETLNAVVDAELEALPADMLARFHYISELIEEFGMERVREPHVKHLRGSLWEMLHEGQRRCLPSPLRDGGWPARRGGPGVCEENVEDAEPRDRAGAQAGKGD
jgi:hypothetical protein